MIAERHPRAATERKTPECGNGAKDASSRNRGHRSCPMKRRRQNGKRIGSDGKTRTSQNSVLAMGQRQPEFLRTARHGRGGGGGARRPAYDPENLCTAKTGNWKERKRQTRGIREKRQESRPEQDFLLPRSTRESNGGRPQTGTVNEGLARTTLGVHRSRERDKR